MAWGQIILSEIMFDPSGSDAHDEFVEVFNISDDLVDLAGWQISDGTAEDIIIPFAEGTLLLPRQYGLILDSSYFANSDSYDSLIPDSCVVMTIDNPTFGSSGFSNSTPEDISLINPDGIFVTSYTYSLDNSPGTSDEKIALTRNNNPINWANSLTILGSPGAPNTNRRLDVGLIIDPASVQLAPSPIYFEDEVIIHLTVYNTGAQELSAFSLTVSVETGTGFQEVSVFDFGTIISGDSTRIEIPYRPLIAGVNNLSLTISSAGNSDTFNEVRVEVPVVVRAGDVLINEIMYSVLDEESEWVEIFNLSPQTTNLQRWRLSDARAPSDVLLSSFYLEPNNFALLSESEVPFTEPIVLSSWPALNNSEERVAILDAGSLEIDSVPYRATWGGDRGISLERISHHSASDDPRNWTSSVAAEGGTPGAVNSVFNEAVPNSLALDVSPNPFSPDGDGHDDYVVVSYNLPSTTADIRVQVYDLRGRLINDLVNSAPSGAHGAIVWDGKDQNGAAARIGVYVVFLEALNAREGVLVTARKTVVVATHL